MTKSEFVQEIKDEIRRIKSHATRAEIDRLDFNSFDKDSVNSCIYGQMTGRCDSSRARKLMPKKYEDVFKLNVYGVTQRKTFTGLEMMKGANFTALEKYLYITGDDTHQHIIDYLKDRTKRLNIK